MVWNKGLKGVQIAWNKGKKCDWVTKRNLEDNPSKKPKVKEKISKHHIDYYKTHKNPFAGKKHKKSSKIKIGLANKGRLVGDKNPSKRLEVRIKIQEKKKEWWRKIRKTEKYELFCEKLRKNKTRAKKISNALSGVPKSEESTEKRRKILKDGYANGVYKIWCEGHTKENDKRLQISGLKSSKAKKEFFKKYPEKHPNRIMAKKKGKVYISKPQRKLFEFIKKRFNDAELEFTIRTEEGVRFADIGIPSLFIDFEYNGYYKHFTPDGIKKDMKRTREISNSGWGVIVFEPEDLGLRKN